MVGDLEGGYTCGLLQITQIKRYTTVITAISLEVSCLPAAVPLLIARVKKKRGPPMERPEAKAWNKLGAVSPAAEFAQALLDSCFVQRIAV
jgi:hypothetical protein